MHSYQKAFYQGFADWNAEEMAASFVRILALLQGRPLSADEISDATWECREVLETFRMCPRLGQIHSLDPANTNVLIIDADARDLRGLVKKQYSRVAISLRLGARSSPELQERWRKSGFTDDEIQISRKSLRTVRPLPSESGYVREADLPSIHRLPGELKAPESQTYDHALAKERSDGEMISRYKGGDQISVWARMVELGYFVRDEAVLPDAVTVARETMRRCRVNVDVLASRLQTMGYEFWHPEEVFVPPPHDILDRIAELEEQVGPIPLSLAAWCEQVGSVNFTGHHPDWPLDLDQVLPDPLEFDLENVLAYDEESWSRHQYQAIFAPDEYHKAEISGGPPYAIFLPDAAADAAVQNEWHGTTFVRYLRHAFEWGGFPGWQRAADSSLRSTLVGELTQGLLPI